MDTIRNPENLENKYGKVYQYGFGGFGVVLSLITMVLILIWILTDDMGGLDIRTSELTTAYFNWHPLLMSMAFLLFMSPATLAFEVYKFRRSTNKNIHSLFQTAAVICLIAGFLIIWDCHMVLSTHGLALSVHSIAGYICIGLVGITYLMGFIMYVLKFGGTLRGDLKPLHKRLGLISLMMGYATILMGITSKASYLEGSAVQFAQVIVGLVIGVSISVTFSVVKFVDKKDGFVYKPIPNPDEATVQLM